MLRSRPCSPSPPPRPVARPTSRQLPLPLLTSGLAGGAPPARSAPAAPALGERSLAQIWASLPPPAQAQVRGTLCRILQEVVRDARHG